MLEWLMRLLVIAIMMSFLCGGIVRHSKGRGDHSMHLRSSTANSPAQTRQTGIVTWCRETYPKTYHRD